MEDYCKFGNFRKGFIFPKLRENKTLTNREITLSFTEIGKSRPCRKFLTAQICVLTLFAKIKFSRKFPNLQ